MAELMTKAGLVVGLIPEKAVKPEPEKPAPPVKSGKGSQRTGK